VILTIEFKSCNSSALYVLQSSRKIYLKVRSIGIKEVLCPHVFFNKVVENQVTTIYIEGSFESSSNDTLQLPRWEFSDSVPVRLLENFYLLEDISTFQKWKCTPANFLQFCSGKNSSFDPLATMTILNCMEIGTN
jgi:hypothetical protein